MPQKDTGKKLEELVVEIDSRLEEASDPLQFSSPITEQEQKGNSRRCVLLACGKFNLAVPLEGVVEITNLPVMTTLPNLPRWIQGVVSVRGEVISVIDIAGYKGWTTATNLYGERLVVIQGDDIKIGLRADNVIGSKIIDFSSDIVQDLCSPQDESVQFSEGIEIDGRIYCLISPKRLLVEKKMTGL